MDTLEKAVPTFRDVSIAVGSVRSGVIGGYMSPKSAARKLKKIAEEYSDLVSFERVISMFKDVRSSYIPIQDRIRPVLDVLDEDDM